ncbi:MAG: hypothetical protein QJR08_03640 [Bacillota bacterium]|nr:hypothetical protein [Bacillota bacterium]
MTEHSDPKHVAVTIDARMYKPRTFFLRQGLASAEREDGIRYEVSTNIDGSTVLVRREGGPWLAIPLEELVRAYDELGEAKRDG